MLQKTSFETAWGGITGARWYLDYVFIQVCVRWAVPCFIMISGFLLLDDKKEIGFQKLKKYIIKMISVLLTFGLAYCFMEAAANEGLENILYVAAVSVKNLIEGRSWTHMWYIYMMLGLYLMLPLFRAFTKSADEKTYRFVLIILFLLTIVRPTINGLFKTAIEIFVPINTAYPFYFLMGYYIRKYGIKRNYALLCLAVGTLGLTISSILEAGNQPENLFAALYSTAIFSLSADSRFLEKCSENILISQVSKYSFGIYLIHPFFLNVLNKVMHVFPDILPIGIGEAAFFGVAAAGAYLTTRLLCKISIMRKILM